MKNINILLKSFLIFIICITSVTCSLSIDEISKDQSNQNEMVLVRFGVFDLPSRSVMPVMPTAADISYFYLYGISSADTVTDQVRLGLFSDNLSDANVLLKPGTWNFTLIAYNDYDIPILSGVRNNIIITTGYTGTVNFNLETISVSSYEGIVSIILELPFDVTIASVETVIDSVILTPPLSVADRAIQFNDTMPAGDYLINFFLKDSESRALAVITEIVVVRSGLLSSKLITLTKDDFNSPPAAPSNFKIVSYIDGFLTFNWVRNSLNETGF
ncbi:MAG: hypothetical protein FWD26_04715, partial [Treponema sp.]|nr:hypothetical protein [Treponema sp.]